MQSIWEGEFTLRKTRKPISVILTLALMLTMVFSMVGSASAAGTFSALSAPTVGAGVQNLGTIYGEFSAGSLSTGDVLTIKLPTDFVVPVGAPAFSVALAPPAGPGITLWAPPKVGSDINSLRAAGMITPARVADNEVSFTIAGAPTPAQKGFVYIYMSGITVPGGFDGDVEATLTSNAGFGSGTVVIGKSDRGSITVTSDNAPAFSDTLNVTLRVSENMAGAMATGGNSLTLGLPSGFEWAAAPAPAFGATIWGDTLFVPGVARRATDFRYLDVTAPALASTAKTCFTITGRVRVADPTVAKYGDVAVVLGGNSRLASTADVVIGTYGEFGTEVTAASAKDVYAGQLKQKIADITIEEKAPGSLVASAAGRSIILTLPANAKWGKIDRTPTVKNLTLAYTGFVGSDARSIRYDLTAASTTQSGKITFEDMEVVLAADVVGDLNVQVSGSAGAEGDVVVANIKAPIAATSTKNDVKIGVQGQVAADITLTESAKGLLKTNENLTLTLPVGARFDGTPTVKVTAGNVNVDTNNVRVTGNDSNVLLIPIKADGSTPATIEVTGIKYTVDRTVPEGDLKVQVGGGAINCVNDDTQINDWCTLGVLRGIDIDGVAGDDYTVPVEGLFPGANEVAKTYNANCITPAPGETKTTAKLVIDSTTMQVNGVDVTMDVAPYIKNGRTYVPVRYVAQALGVSPENIFYDNGVVTLLKDLRAVQMTIGSKALVINGVSIQMDAAPEIANGGRTMLPFRWVAQALGATVNWDETTRTVTMEL